MTCQLEEPKLLKLWRDSLMKTNQFLVELITLITWAQRLSEEGT